jgi:hypothetical protein
MRNKRRIVAAVALACLLPSLALAGAGQPVTSQNISTTITSGGSFQTLTAANQARNGCLIQNPTTATEPLYVYFGSGTASVAASFSLAPGAAVSCSFNGAVATDAIQVEATTTSHAFTAQIQ